jgi:hypothetical protein
LFGFDVLVVLMVHYCVVDMAPPSLIPKNFKHKLVLIYNCALNNPSNVANTSQNLKPNVAIANLTQANVDLANNKKKKLLNEIIVFKTYGLQNFLGQSLWRVLRLMERLCKSSAKFVMSIKGKIILWCPN